MKPKLNKKERLELIRRVEEGESVTKVCKEAGISRPLFYRWKKRYKKEGEEALAPISHGRPSKGEEVKEKFSKELSPSTRSKMVEEVLLQDQNVSEVADKYGVSRPTVYKWIKRYKKKKEKGREPALVSKEPEVERYWRQAPEKHVDAVLSVVEKHPEYGIRRILKNLPQVAGKPVIGHHGVQNILRRHNLSTYEQRLAYAEKQITPITRSISDILAKAGAFFTLQPEKRRRYIKLLGTFLGTAFLTVVAFGLGGVVSESVFGSEQSNVGLFFSYLSLLMGSVFFLYSLKYYLTIAIVLSFSQQETSELNGGNGNGRGKGILKWILGIEDGPKEEGEPTDGRSATGLSPNLDHVKLDRYPYISVQIPFYNEKYVVERAMEAATSFDYKGEYEVMLCDDSTDETTDIIREYMKEHLTRGEKLQVTRNKEEGWELATVEVKPGVTLKHLHRISRSGYKGGALKIALELVDPRTEFVSVFDADFVPYPDTLYLFLKYFKAQAGTLDFGKGDEKLEAGNNTDPASNFQHPTSRIAAVQGYQWHVLNKSENWITRGVRSEYSGSYVIERSGQEIYGGLKHISGSVYMIRRDVLEDVGWKTSITEDYELTLRLYEKGYKVVYTPYVQAPAECVSTLKRLIRQRMRWAEGHSHNVKLMAKRLLFGKWEDIGSREGGGKLEAGKNISPASSIQHPQSASKTFIPSPLNFSEKIEFLFNVPYYLQAFFFLVGTVSWITAEAIFQTRLPFWTELWGWSLVLTNMLSLPLLNAVGMFLEESEERDYMGLASFVALSYILVPFQAYASVKGFLEKEEGPWFRTPKTGRITDVFTRGRFYRFIQGILPGSTEVAAKMTPSNLNQYLAIETANNTFDKFNIKKRKNRRWLGRVAISFMLIISTTLTYFAPFIESTTAEEVNRGAPGGGVLVSPEEKVGVEVETGSERLEAGGGEPDAGIEMPRLVQEVNAASDIDNSKDFDTGVELKTSSLMLEGQKDFSYYQTPKFKISKNMGITEKIKDKLLGTVGIKDEKGRQYIAEVIDNSTGRKVEQFSVSDKGSGEFQLEKKGKVSPGVYSLIVKDGKGNGLIQDFSWGVLAINTNKSIYSPNDIAHFAMAVLDSGGHMVCDAGLRLKVQTPDGEVEILSTHNGKIRVNDDCKNKGFTEVPDYEAEMQLGEAAGAYKMTLAAETDSGEYVIGDSFEVKESVPYDIERSAPTRIYPPVNYPVRISVKANKDYAGYVEEKVPSEFELIQVQGSNIDEFLQNDNQGGIISDLEVEESQGEKIIRWFVDFKEGETYHLNYLFRAPDRSPEFYTLGPVWIDGFTESRVWQIAADATASMILLWDQASPDAPTDWTCISCGSGDFYQKFIRGAADYNATGGGSANHTHTVSTTVNASSASAGENRSGSSVSAVNHGHGFSPTISSESNLPSHSTLKIIQYDFTGEPSTIPENAIAFFDSDGSMPNGDWTRYSTQDGSYIYGENSAGTTGGSNTHNHDISGSLGAADTTTLDTRGGPQTEDVATGGHTHTYPTTGTGDNVNLEPPYIEVVLGQVTNASGTTPPNGMIAMFNKGSGDTYPTNWEDRSGSGQPFNQKFLKPATSYGTTGGSSSHNHNDVTGVSSDVPSGVTNGRTGTAGADDLHTHSVDVTNFNSPSHLPPYIDVAFAEKNAAIDISGNLYEKGTTTASNLCDDSTAVLAARVAGTTETTSCSSSDGSFTFSQVSIPSAGDGIVIWIDGQTEDGATVVRYDGSGNTTANIVYEDVVTVTSDDTNAVDILDMDFYDNGNDADIPYTATDATPDTLSVNSGFEFLVQLKSGVANGSTVFDPNGTVTTNATGGLFHIDDNAVAYLDTASNSIGTDITIDTGATLNIDANTTVNGGDITVTGTLATTTGTPTVTMAATGTIGGGGTITFHDLAINDAVTTTIGSTITVEGGDLTTTSGGSVDYSNTPTVNIDATGTLGGGTGSITFYDLSLGPNTTGTSTLGTSVAIDNSLTVASSHTFAMSTFDTTVGSTSVSGSGDVTINGSTSQSSAGTFTILSNTSDAQLSGSGTLTVYNLTIGNGTNTVSVDNETSDLPIDAAGSFNNQSNSTFSASSTASFNVGGDFTNNGTFTANSGTATMDGGGGFSYNIQGTLTGSSSFYNLSFDDSGSSSEYILDTTNLTVNNNLTITSGIVTAPSGTLSVGANFTNNDTFTHNSGTVSLAGAADTTQTITGATTFNNLSATTGDRVIEFTASTTFTINNNLTLTGTSCTEFLVLRSTTAGTAYTLSHNTGATNSFDYIDMQDTTWTSAPSGLSNSVDSGGNSNVTIAASGCIGASTDANDTATGYSFQRKTFYDDVNARYFLFYHDGDEVEVRYSSDASTWSVDDDHLAYDTNDFSVWWKQISTTEYVWLATVNNNDIVVRRGSLSTSGITWDGTTVTAMDGTGANDSYSRPYISLDSSNYIWIGARHYDGSNYNYKAVRSDSTADSTWSSMAFGGTIAEQQLTDNQTDANVYGNITPFSSQDMYATFVAGTALEGCKWVHSSTEWQDSSGSTCVPTTGAGDTLTEPTDNLSAYWKMDEASWNGTSGEITDSAGTNNGTAAGSATTVAKGFDRSGTFDGTGDYFDTSSDAINRSSGSISFWMNRSTTSTNPQSIFLASSDSTSDGFSVGDPDDEISIGIRPSDASSDPNELIFTHQYGDDPADTSVDILFSDITISASEWYHVVATWNLSGSDMTIKLYLDGVLKDSSTWTTSGTPATFFDTNRIAATFHSTDTREFPGELDDMRVYNGALTSDEVYDLYRFTPSKVNIDDASDFGAMIGEGRQVVTTSAGTLYAVILDDNTDIEVWKSTDGATWAEQDSANGPTATNDIFQAPSVSIDSNGTIHIAYVDADLFGDDQVEYETFSTSTDTFSGTPESIDSTTGEKDLAAISVDSNDIPHVVYSDGSDLNYANRVGGSWSTVVVEAVANNSRDITINEDNIPEISYINSTDGDLTAAVGDDNDPDTSAQWTLHDVDTDVNDTSGERGTSIAVDHDGNTWIAYVDDTGGDGGTTPDEVTIVKHNDADAWTTWQTPVSTGTVGNEPSIAIGDGRDVYVFYETQSSGNADDIAYDVYDADADSPTFSGETVLNVGTYQDVKAKWSFEWNNYGANRIDYLFSDGTDIYWDYLYLRREPTNMDDASDFGPMVSAGRQIVRTSEGVLYTVLKDEGEAGDPVEVWKSTDEGNTWSEQDAANKPSGKANFRMVPSAIDSGDIIHIIYGDETADDLMYNTFSTSTDSFGTEETIPGSDVLEFIGLALDSNDVPHVVHGNTDGSPAKTYYSNKVGGSWDASPVEVESGVFGKGADIIINEDNIPEISYIDDVVNDLTAAVGNQNDATSFTLHDVDTDVNVTLAERGTSISVDSSGNSWIAYIDEDGTDDFVTLAKHDDASAWTSGWTTDITNSNVGFEPSIAIDGTDIYVFYEDDQDDIVFDKYDGTSWDGETVLEMHGALQDVKAKWSYLNNYGSDGTDYGSGGSGIPEIDYIYSDGTDVFYNRFTIGSTPGSQDAIDTIPANISDNISAVSNGTDTVHLLFIDDETTDQVSYKRYASGSWGNATLVADAASDDDAYVTLSHDTDADDLYALWIDTGSSVDDIFYSSCDISTVCDAASEWAAETTWKNTGINTNVTSNYNGATRVFAEWTVGDASPYAVQSDTVVVPELLWVILPMGPLLPLLLKYRRKKDKKAVEKLYLKERN